MPQSVSATRVSPRKRLNPLLRVFGRVALRLLGWRYEGGRGDMLRKAVLIAAPHQTNWDLLYTLLASFAMDMPIQFMMKHTLFRFPLNLLWPRLGGVSVNRKAAANLVQQMVREFETRDDMILVIAPEGTRGHVPHWKLGFYWMALKADVPVLIGAIDYKTRKVHVGPAVRMTGDLDEDFAALRAHYLPRVGVDPRYPPQDKPVAIPKDPVVAEVVNT